jgi:hypothetical protein
VDPLVDPYPFFIFPDQKNKIALIMFQSDDYAGVVTLQVDCCTDLTGGPVPPPTGVSLGFGGPLMPSSRAAKFSGLQTTGLSKGPPPPPPPNLQPNQFVTGAHEVHTVGLHVTTTPDAQTGIFVATVTAAKSDGSSASTRVIINILPTFVNQKTPTCAAFTTDQTGQTVPTGAASSGSNLIPTDNLGPLTLSVFDAKVQMPANTAWQMGYGISNSDNGQGNMITLSKSPLPLTPKQANFVFHNGSQYDKQYVLFDTAMCAPSTPPITLKSGERASFLASSPTTTTLFLRAFDGKDWKSLAKLSEVTPFWTVFGGKEVDFEWIPENTVPKGGFGVGVIIPPN